METRTKSAMAIDWERPFLIGSSPSSGSTLLSVMLDAHPDILVGPELSLFSHPFFWEQEGPLWRERLLRYIELGVEAMKLPEWRFGNGVCAYTELVYGNTLPWYGSTRGDLKALVRRSECAEELVRLLYEPILKLRRKIIWGEKSPPNIYSFRAFLDRYPKGRVVHLVRDGRDVVLSLLKRGFAFRTAASLWLFETALGRCLANHPRVFQLRYEDLVCDPRRSIDRLSEFLEIPPATDVVLRYTETSSRVKSDRSIVGYETWSSNPLQGLSPRAIGSWKYHLTPAQLMSIYAAFVADALPSYEGMKGKTAVELLVELGYDSVHVLQSDAGHDLDAVLRETIMTAEASGGSGSNFHEQFVAFDRSLVPFEVAQHTERCGGAEQTGPLNAIRGRPGAAVSREELRSASSTARDERLLGSGGPMRPRFGRFIEESMRSLHGTFSVAVERVRELITRMAFEARYRFLMGRAVLKERMQSNTSQVPPWTRVAHDLSSTPVDEYWNMHTVNSIPFRSERESLRYIRWRFREYPRFQELMELYGTHRGEVVLDFGCGPGDDVVGYLNFSNARKVIGIDVSEKALRVARQRLALHHVETHRVELIHSPDGNATIPLADESVDYLHCGGVVHHVSCPLLVLGEFYRILKPKSVGFVMVYNRNSVWRHLYTAYERMILQNHFQGLDIDQAFARNTDGEHCPESRSYEPEEFIAICRSAGLEATFKGAYFAMHELNVLRRLGKDAVGDERLPEEHRQFLRDLTYDKKGLPIYHGHYAGIGGVYRIHKT